MKCDRVGNQTLPPRILFRIGPYRAFGGSLFSPWTVIGIIHELADFFGDKEEPEQSE